MAVTLTTAAKTAGVTAIRDHFANGTLEILTAGDVVLATFGLDAAGGTVAGAVWTLVFDATTVAAAATGTAAKAQIKTSGGVANLTGLTVGITGADANFTNTAFASGQNITVPSATYTFVA